MPTGGVIEQPAWVELYSAWATTQKGTSTRRGKIGDNIRAGSANSVTYSRGIVFPSPVVEGGNYG
jgi:hypothetical protein